MGFFRGVGRVTKPLVNVPKWMDAKRIGQDAGYISAIAKSIFSSQRAKHKESFEGATKRLNLSHAVLQQRYKEFRRLFIIFLLISLLILAYTLLLLIEGSWRAFFMSTVVFFIAFVQVYRYHFWMYQIKQRRLGCSFREWFKHLIKR